MEDFTEFVRGNGTRLIRVAYLLTGDRQDAEDLVQTVLARLSLRWSRVAGVDDPAAYARKSLLNTWRNARRRRWWNEWPSASVPDRAVADESGRYDTYHDLLQALRTLPSRSRAVIVLRYYEDLSERETAALLGCSVGAIKAAASRGLAAMRARFDDGESAKTTERLTLRSMGEDHALHEC